MRPENSQHHREPLGQMDLGEMGRKDGQGGRWGLRKGGEAEDHL